MSDSLSIRTLVAIRQELVGQCLIELLSVHPSFLILAVARSVDEIGKCIGEHCPELVFLDLDLSEVVPEMIPLFGPEVKIVFLASDEDFALRAFQLGAVDYLLKPVSTGRLHLTAMRILAGREAGAGQPPPEVPFDPSADGELRFLLPSGRGKQAEWVSCSRIAWIQAEQNYSRVQLHGGAAFLLKRTLTEWEARLPMGDFIRLERSLIIQHKLLQAIERKSRDVAALRFEDMEMELHVGRVAVSRLRAVMGGR
ncbi:response regulator transcription factor [Luteolibacter yonseiensis]|uniref:Response regulator transcription factor n=1 Tax=Luteolibacter yonseiensis TaxID=1144680 RepID=A0A934V9L7_9BACT|nr:LytTR family DNA-binding domain-containing protein [Luteolibacter yonseiensis]MBK1814295.1 response regulator transcription factor [Luteolibacter yonseiensis]